jgi:hypothetical protein
LRGQSGAPIFQIETSGFGYSGRTQCRLSATRDTNGSPTFVAKADLYRHVASIPSFGGSEADRVLILAAERLEREATALKHSFIED